MSRLILAVVLGLMLVAASGALADQTDKRLDPLFARLQKAGSEEEAHQIETMIWKIWTETADHETEEILRQGVLAMNADDEAQALAAFDVVVSRDRNFAEGWNKKATVEYLMGDYDASVTDIERTLALEPRHFGALSGLGQIYLALENKRAALKAFEAALAIDPHLDGMREEVERLKKELKGDPI
ncbi:MAG TPA: tetratricopeptide repeat protein [Stellaceae bacterium]|nr:tetratricopeptide repeat protein [Stellaceae bacterium]